MKRAYCRFAALLLAFYAAPLFLRVCVAQSNAAQAAATETSKLRAEQMRLTTKSETARAAFGQAVTLSGNYRLDECLRILRAAVSEDPNFAAGWSLLGFYATDSRESTDALSRAEKLVGKASPSEMLFVHWVGSTKRNDQLGAISNLNDLVRRETGDKFILYLAGHWFLDQHNQQKAAPLFEKVLALDPQFTPALNRMGYAYAAAGDMPRAEELMQRYVAVMPDDPNPEDSYGDILFKAGRFEEARTHFEAALKKDRSFGPSQHELGDVYAMLGNPDAAREAYQKSAVVAANPRRSLEYRSSIALSYVRQNQLALADQEYAALAAEAKHKNFSDLEAGFQESMALYQPIDSEAVKHLDAAEAAVRNDTDLATVTRDEHMAMIRRWRGVRALHAGNPAMAEVCIHVLQQKYQETENEMIGNQLHALNGAWLFASHKYAEAAAELEQVDSDGFALEMLARAKREAGDAAGADAALRKLLAIHASTIDAVLVVEPARQKFSLAATTSSKP